MQRVRDSIKLANLDKNGVFKYIQILIEPFDSPEPGNEYLVVRGWADCAYHADILNKFRYSELGTNDLEDDFRAESPGGGRIEVNEGAKTILIYGYSQGFGRANHALTKEILENSGQYKDYVITWSNDGY